MSKSFISHKHLNIKVLLVSREQFQQLLKGGRVSEHRAGGKGLGY